MTIGGGEAADQLVRMMLSGTEVAVRLSGSALKNLLALTMALASNRKVLSGKVNMGKMLRETRDLRRFPMTPQQYKQFKKLAKKHKLLYSVIRDKDDKGKVMDVILPVTELDRANAIFERILYTLPPEPERKPARELQQGHRVFQPERQVQERQTQEQVQVRRQERQAPARPKDKRQERPSQEQQAQERQTQEQEQVRRQERQAPKREGERKPPVRKPEGKPTPRPQEGRPGQVQPQREVSQRSAEQGRQEAPVTRQAENAPKNGSRSERDSPVIKISSSTHRESGTTRGTSERPSIEARLKGYRAQQRKASVPAKEITKAKAKVKPQAKAR